MGIAVQKATALLFVLFTLVSHASDELGSSVANGRFEVILPDSASSNEFRMLEWSTNLVDWIPVARDYRTDWENTFPHALPISTGGVNQVLSDPTETQSRFYRVITSSTHVLNNSHSVSRFLQQANCAAIGTASLFSTLFTLRMTAGAASGTPVSGYKALVCLFLSGGNDSYNMLVPKDAAAYAEYATVRTTLALPQSNLLPITSTGQSYTDFGIHHHLPFLQTRYNAGELAFVSNVGTLVEPTTLAQFQAKSTSLPVGLFSHSDEQVHWQTLVPCLPTIKIRH